MNDRFRFRVWDERTKTCFDNGMIETLAPISTWIKNGWIVEQCTGLKDKNGKLIYEGDLVKLPVNCNKELHGVYTTQEVVWRNGFWLLSYVSSQKGLIIPRGYSAGFLHDYLNEDFNEDFLFGNNDMFCKYKQLEVIGNIHENPELLEVEK